MVFPWPRPDAEEQIRVRELCARAREIGDSIDHRQVEEDRWIGDDVIRELGDAGLCGLYVDEKYGGQGLSQTGYARVFETFAQIDGTLSIILGVHQSIGYKGIVLFGTDEQKERFLPDLAAGRKLAGFALTEPMAGLGRLQPAVPRRPPARRLLGPERREALHRQRLEGRRVHDVRPRRGRRQGSPHRADPREGDGGLRGRRALRHDGPARQRPPPPLLPRRQGAAGERPRRAGRGLQDRDVGAQQRPDRARHRARSARPRSCST